MATFTAITLDEMRGVLREQNGWRQVEPAVLAAANVQEHVFEWDIPKVGKPVKVYTSIDVQTDVTRSVGSDAIRVCVPGWLKSQRVHRVEGWRQNLIERVRAAIADVRERFAMAEVQKAAQPAPTMYLGVLGMFANAAASKLKRPGISFGVGTVPVKISLAGKQSKYAGDLIVTDGGPYGASTFYGVIRKDGSWMRTKHVTPEVGIIVDGFNQNPAGFAAEYGKRTGQCCFCNLPLSTDESLHVGYGPICAKKFHLPWGHVESEVQA